jgi:ribosomal protein L11 methyltransferase
MNYAARTAAAPTLTATLITDEQSARRVADCFAESLLPGIAASLAENETGTWRVTLYFGAAIKEAQARALTAAAAGPAAGSALSFARVPAKNWVAASLQGLKPIAAGRFVVHGARDRGCAPANRIAVEIEAALAFGTGHHGTTRGCLLALDGICKSLNGSDRKRRMLDLGTGTGVLAIAAARSLRRCVLASDIDVQAVQITRDNARLNRAGGLIRVVRAAGLAAPDIRRAAPFDLVFANILLAPLQRLAAPLCRSLAPGGRLVISGILKSQANAALAAYRRLTLERRIELDGWTTLVLKRRATLRLQGRVN